MTSQIDWILSLPPEQRRAIVARLGGPERQVLIDQIQFRKDNRWLQYQGDPVRFVEEGLNEVIWGKQREILNSLMENQRTAVPACHAPGKSHIAGRAVAYWAACHPPGTAKVLTTATTYRQVERVLWPHIRRLHARHMPKLGYTNKVEWMMGHPLEAVAEGFKPPDDDEAATQGTHAPNLLIIVDEAGGIKSNFGANLESLMTGGNTRMLILGNPPVDEEQTWFERLCNSPRYNVIRIGWEDTPNFTGEETGPCGSCPPGVPEHKVATHLIDKTWVEGVIEEFGRESAYYMARVDAQFPRDNSSKALPMSWLEMARDKEKDPEPKPIKLGCDIASDGGDEFSIAWAEGFSVKLVHAKAGSDNEDPLQVAGKIKEWILKAEKYHRENNIPTRVRVKIDSIGVGWGVTGTLQGWKREGQFNAEIIGVNVARKAREDLRHSNQRSELWWNTRKLIQPRPDENGLMDCDLRLDISPRELSQLNGPTYGNDSAGRITIEKKSDMKKRGVGSPDRAEAILLALYEPPSTVPPPPFGMKQENQWVAGFTKLNL